jgi:hypothetical protein
MYFGKPSVILFLNKVVTCKVRFDTEGENDMTEVSIVGNKAMNFILFEKCPNVG